SGMHACGLISCSARPVYFTNPISFVLLLANGTSRQDCSTSSCPRLCEDVSIGLPLSDSTSIRFSIITSLLPSSAWVRRSRTWSDGSSPNRHLRLAPFEARESLTRSETRKSPSGLPCPVAQHAKRSLREDPREPNVTAGACCGVDRNAHCVRGSDPLC